MTKHPKKTVPIIVEFDGKNLIIRGRSIPVPAAELKRLESEIKKAQSQILNEILHGLESTAQRSNMAKIEAHFNGVKPYKQPKPPVKRGGRGRKK